MHSCSILVFKLLIPCRPILYLLPLPPHHRPLLLAVLLRLLLPLPPDSIRILQWNAGGLRARSTKLLYFLSSHPVDLICIQESNLNSSSTFQIPGFSALRSDCTHSRSGIFSRDATHASGGVIIFVRQGLSSSTATGPDKVAYPMLKHLPRSDMDFLLHIFNLSWNSHSFPFIWKTSSIILINKMGKPLDSPASFRPISLTFCVLKLFEHIILCHLLFFLESNSILSPHQAGFRPGRSTLDQILFLSQCISDGFNKSRPGSRTILSTIDFSKAFDSVWHPALFHKLISAGFPPCFARWTQSFLSDRRASFIKITKVAPFESVKVFRKDPLLALYFSLSSTTIFRLLCLLPSAALFTMTIGPFGPPPPQSPLRWRPLKELCFD